MKATLRIEDIQNILNEVKDPEIPVLSIADLGILRSVKLNGDLVEITITPTYMGCPAMRTIEDEIKSVLKQNGIEPFKINTVMSPAWTTDWMTEDAKEKLRLYGIAPPSTKKIDCPHCGSSHTEMISQFGSTACKALYRCLECKEPFDYFKCH